MKKKCTKVEVLVCYLIILNRWHFDELLPFPHKGAFTLWQLLKHHFLVILQYISFRTWPSLPFWAPRHFSNTFIFIANPFLNTNKVIEIRAKLNWISKLNMNMVFSEHHLKTQDKNSLLYPTGLKWNIKTN